MIESKLPVNCCNYLKYTITPIRLIPADLGYTITNQHVSVIKDLLTQNGMLFSENIPIFGENALFKISLCHNLEAYIYYDGIIIFVFIDECLPYHYFKIDDVGFILENRKNAHKLLLTHNHSISKKIDELCFTLRNLVDESLRRLTSYPSWENGSLSYVMSFYHINADSKIYHDELFVSCLSQLLYPDHHTYYGGVRANVTDNYKEKVLVNHDVLDNVHVSISWANVIIVGELTNSQLSYYTTLELSLQHIWMYSYVTEKMIDALLESSYFGKKTG